MRFTLEKIDLELKVLWRISRGADRHKTNWLVSVSEGGFSGYGEAAWMTAHAPDEGELRKIFASFSDQVPKNIHSVESLSESLDNFIQGVDHFPMPLRFAIESSFVHYLASVSDRTVQQILGLNTQWNVPTSHSVPIMPVESVADYINKNRLQRFNALKVKISGIHNINFVKEVARNFSGPLRLDANEGLQSAGEVIRLAKELSDLEIELIEQPLPDGAWDDYRALKGKLPFPVIADESLKNGPVTQELLQYFDGVNVKLMKAGGYLRALRQLREAKELGMKTMLGCMIETSLGIASAMNISWGVDFVDLDGFLFLSNDPFGHIVEENGNLVASSLH